MPENLVPWLGIALMFAVFFAVIYFRDKHFRERTKAITALIGTENWDCETIRVLKKQNIEELRVKWYENSMEREEKVGYNPMEKRAFFLEEG